MSSIQPKTTANLKSNLGKRKKGEEYIDDDDQSPVNKQNKRSNHRQHNSAKKRKRDKSESSTSRNADMHDVNEGEDDSEDDEDDYDDEEDAELDGFIAPDDEVQRELEEEQEQYRKEYRTEKKKHKRRVEPALDEDDLELIQENIGIPVQKQQKKRRLHKNIEPESPRDNEDEDRAEAKVRDIGRDERRRGLDQYDTQMVDEDDLQIDTGTQNRQMKAKAIGREKQYDETQIMTDRAQPSRHIFEDPDTLRDRVAYAQRQKEQDKKADQKATLEELFDGDEIDDQFATKADKAIAENDIPERLQIKLENRLSESMPDTIDDDIAKEVDWIYKRLTEEYKKDQLLYQEQQAKHKIEKVLRYFRCDYMDIPFIAKYRKYEYMKELQEDDIWIIFNLDLEYGRFQQQLYQMTTQLKKLSQIDPRVQEYVSQIMRVSNLQQLQNFSPLIAFMKSYHHEELSQMPEERNKKLPTKQDSITQAKKYKLDQIAQTIFLDPMLFVENLLNNTFIHKPNLLNKPINDILAPYLCHQFETWDLALAAVLKFQAQQLSVQPYLRSQLKKHMYNIGTLYTEPTEAGNKELDPFHPSYRVKRIKNEPLNNLGLREGLQDLFLDVTQIEKAGLITVKLQYDQNLIQQFQDDLIDKYAPREYHQDLIKIYRESIRMTVMEQLVHTITNEIKDELRQQSEQFVIKRCQEQYRSLLMTGPFSCDEYNKQSRDDYLTSYGGRNRREDDPTSIVPDRPRCTVMGVILQQIDANNQLVAIAIVDKHGELVAHKDLQHLMPPRKFMMQSNPGATDEEDQRYKKAKLQHNEEVKEHEADKDKIKELMLKHQVDLVVVGANKLGARQVKKVLSEIAEGIKQFGSGMQQDDYDTKKGSKKRGADTNEDYRKEAFVIWGSLEIPKLFANSHQSQKLLKGFHPVLKQAVCLARYEQDPMNEILNLWSFVPSENQTLQINLHPLQKLINQAKLSDALEEINIQCVNAVGIDINLALDHDHMHILLSFISCFGPRKAKQFIQDLKSRGTKVLKRSDLYSTFNLGKHMYLYSCAFMKIRLNHEDKQGSSYIQEILELTRVHPESYMLAHKVAKDVIYSGQGEVDMIHTQKALTHIIQNPSKLKELDLKQYSLELEQSDQQNMFIVVEYIIEELSNPYKDPREYRNPVKQNISNQDLFYMLIEESDKTFKKGIIVTATVQKVFDNMVICKLDNGLDATIQKNDLEKTDDRAQNLIQPGQVVTGRIHEVMTSDETKFKVTLNCKRRDLESHENYIDRNLVDQDDWKNYAFAPDHAIKQQKGIIFRRIQHPKFKNITSNRALQELQDKEEGDFMFRPSSKGENNITLTWKFYQKNFVHIDIVEHDKPVGASIGQKLTISDEIFENLAEIVERYIMPCNKNVREIQDNTKFMHFENSDDVEKYLREEKTNDPSRIPYKLTILPQYPQHVVLAYIPKQSLVKEYIKVKPRGFWFHDKYHCPSQHLINWFKGHYNNKDYIRQMKKQRSPRARIGLPAQGHNEQQNRNSQGDFGSRTQGNDWSSVSKDWQRSGANSVHSLNNDDNEGNTQYAGQTTRGYNPGQSEYGNTNSGRGSGMKCFNCQEYGHPARECPSQQQKSYGRGSKGSTQFGRGQRRANDNNNDHDNNAGSGAQEADTWGVRDVPTTTGGWNDGGKNDSEPMNIDSQGGWGVTNTPGNNQTNQSQSWNQPSATNDWGNNDNNQQEEGHSPARSFKSNDERGGRGRGRGFGRGRGSGNSECFRCGQSGHQAKDCNLPDTRERGAGRGRGGPGGNKCFKCNEEGHQARACPNQDSRQNDRGDRDERGDRGGRGRGRGSGGGDRNCFKCGNQGHFAKECQEQGGYKRQRREDGGSVRRDDRDDDWPRKDDNNDTGNTWQGRPGSVHHWGDDNNNQNNNQAANDKWGANAGQSQHQQQEGTWGNNNNNTSNTGGAW